MDRLVVSTMRRSVTILKDVASYRNLACNLGRPIYGSDLRRHRAGFDAQLGDLSRRLGQGGEHDVVMALANPRGGDQEGGATGVMGGFGVLPFVADDKATVQAEVPFEGGLGQQAGLGLAAGAKIGGVVRADQNVVEREDAAEDIVHAVQFAPGEIAAGELGLVGGGDEQKAF